MMNSLRLELKVEVIYFKSIVDMVILEYID